MSVGKSYYEVSCNEYYNDMLELKKILENNMNKEQVIDFLRKNEIKYEGFEKGNEFVIILNSFDLTFGNDGKLKISEIH